MGYILVKPENSVGPCGEQGKVSLKCFDFSACCNTDDLALTLIHNSEPTKLIVNTITKNELTFTTTELANPYDKIVLTIKGKCCGLGDYGQITIFIKDLCDCVNCAAGFECDKCTKECNAIVDTGELILIEDPEYIAYTDSGLKLN